jgi:hypothetical protein
MASLVHTYELLQSTSTDLSCIKPQVNGLERRCRESLSRETSSYSWGQTTWSANGHQPLSRTK